MRQQDRLGALQMGVARQHGFNMALGKANQNILQFRQMLADGKNGIPQIQAHIQCHLIVAAPGGMQLVRNFACNLGQPGFNMGMNIFQRVAVRQCPGVDFLLYFLKARN